MKKKSEVKIINLREIKRLLEERKKRRLARTKRMQALNNLKSDLLRTGTSFIHMLSGSFEECAEDKKKYMTGIRKVVGKDRSGWEHDDAHAMAMNSFPRSDFNHIPSTILSNHVKNERTPGNNRRSGED
jgi:hypothetical protein